MRRIAAGLALFVFASSALAEVPVSPEFKAAESAALDLSNRAQDLRKQAADDFAASPARNAEGCKDLREANALLLQIHPLAERMIAELEYRKAANVDTYKSFLITTQYTIDNGTAGISSCGEFDPGWTVSPEVTEMRKLTVPFNAARSDVSALQDNADPAAVCAPLEAMLSIAESETARMPGYLAAQGSEDTAAADRETFAKGVAHDLATGAVLWYQRCSDKAQPANYDSWEAAEAGFKAETTTFESVATTALDAMNDPARFDRACVPLRRSMAMLAVLHMRLIRMKTLAAGDASHEADTTNYDNIINATGVNFAADTAGCADGFYARPLFARANYAGSADVRDNYDLIPATLETALEDKEKERQAMHDKVLDAKADFDRDYNGGNDLGLCGDQSYGADVTRQEIAIITSMADAASAYPRLAQRFKAQADAMYDTYKVFFNTASCY